MKTKSIKLLFTILSYIPFVATATISLSQSSIIFTNTPGTLSVHTINLSSTEPLTAWVSATETSRPQKDNTISTLSTLSAPSKFFTLPPNAKFNPNQIFIKLAANGTLPDNYTSIRTFSLLPNLHLVRLPSPINTPKEMETLIRLLNSDPQIISAYPNYTTVAERIPDNTDFSKEWSLNNYGQKTLYANSQMFNGRKGCDINALDAWDVSVGRRDLIVAVIDSGVNYNHEALKDNMWRNPNEIPGNGIDDDGNGYIDDIYGISPVTGSADPMDFNGHGTHCAGIIAASATNQNGIVGVTWNTRIMALKYLGDDGLSRGEEDAIECIQYAIDNGARVISCSWGGDGAGAIGEALRAAIDAGIVVTASAGNDNRDCDIVPHYPACYDLDGIISVMATDNHDRRLDNSLISPTNGSNYGANSVDIAAPGGGIYSSISSQDNLTNDYAYISGTSMATAFVSGGAALLLSLRDNLTPVEIKRILMESGSKVLPEGLCASSARLNLKRAIDYANLWLTTDTVLIHDATNASISVKLDATTLPEGTYEGYIKIFAPDETITMPVTMYIPASTIEITPYEPIFFETEYKSQFTNEIVSYTLFNNSSNSVNWSISSHEAISHISKQSGTLLPNSSDKITLTINQDFVRLLNPGDYTLTISFGCGSETFLQKRKLKFYINQYSTAKKFFVNPSSPISNGDGLTIESPFQDINKALNVAPSGSIIYCNKGTYPPIDANGYSQISIIGYDGKNETIIDGTNLAPCVSLQSPLPQQNTIEGFTIKGGHATYELSGGVTGGIVKECDILGCSSTISSLPAIAKFATILHSKITQSASATTPQIVNSKLSNCLVTGPVLPQTIIENSDLENCTITASLKNSSAVNTIVIAPNTTALTASSATNCIINGDISSDSTTEATIFSSPNLDDAFYPNKNSPAIDSGIIREGMPEKDLAGNDRIFGETIDIGCYEYGSSQSYETNYWIIPPQIQSIITNGYPYQITHGYPRYGTNSENFTEDEISSLPEGTYTFISQAPDLIQTNLFTIVAPQISEKCATYTLKKSGIWRNPNIWTSNATYPHLLGDDIIIPDAPNFTINLNNQNYTISSITNFATHTTIQSGTIKTTGRIENSTQNATLTLKDITIQTPDAPSRENRLMLGAANSTLEFIGNCTIEGRYLRTSYTDTTYIFRNGHSIFPDGWDFAQTPYLYTTSSIVSHSTHSIVIDNATVESKAINAEAYFLNIDITLGERHKTLPALKISDEFITPQGAKLTINATSVASGTYTIFNAPTLPTLPTPQIITKPNATYTINSTKTNLSITIVETCTHEQQISTSRIEPTCTEYGYTAETKCATCGKILIPKQQIRPLGHNFAQREILYDATCTQDGLAISTCTRCQEKNEEVILALGHIWTQWQTIADSKQTRNCTRCGETQTRSQSAQNNLPNGYTPLESISSTFIGKQYINTGISVHNGLIADMTIAINELVPQSQTQSTILGAYSNYNEAYIVSLTQEGTWSASLGNESSKRPSAGTVSINTKYHIVSSITDNNTVTFTVDDTELFSISYKKSGSQSPLYLLARNGNSKGTADRHSVATIYSVKIYSGQELVRNYIPCLNEENEPGLYDTVSEYFYKSESNKPFEAGRKLPKQNTFQDKFYEAQETQTPLEAIEFPQTQSPTSGMEVSLNEVCDIAWDAEEVAKLIPVIAPSGYIARAFIAQDGALCARLATAPAAETLSKTGNLLSISISNPIPSFWYAISESDTPNGTYSLVRSTLQQAEDGKSITITLQTTKKSNFIRLTTLSHR